MGFEILSQRVQLLGSVIMADRLTSSLPNVFLGIEVWGSGWEANELQAGIVF